MNLVKFRPSVAARVYASQWIGDCPVCNSASVLPFGCPVWECRDCGTSLEVRWPSDEVRRGVERLLSLRPIAHTRNWFPGETLHDLLAENTMHGIGPTGEGQHMMILGDQIQLDTLPKPVRRLQIGSR